MGTSFPKKLCSAVGAPATALLAGPRRGRAAYQKFLYLTAGWGVILMLVAPVVKLTAQDEPPQIIVREGPKTKKDNGPRALGLLQLSSNGKATLVPVAILINGKFYDASAYKADPVPMALDAGTVYEAERSGDSLGLFTLNGALHSRDPNSQTPWVATGSYLPNGSVAPRRGRKAESVPVGLENDEGPPRLTRGDQAKPASSGGSASSAPAAGTSEKPGTTVPSSTTPASTTPAAPAGGSSASQPAQPNTSAGSAKPADQTASQTASPTVSQTAKEQPPSKPSGSPSPDDSYRPVLRRGKPTQPLPDDEETMPPAAVSKTANGKTASTASSDNTAQLIPAISDAAGPEPRSYKFDWRRGEEGDRRQQMLARAKEEFQTYLKQQAKATAGEEPPSTKKAGARRRSPQLSQPVFDNVQFKAFDVWVNNEPVMLLSAEAHMPTASGTSATAAGANHYFILLVARTDIYSNLHKLYVGITDKYHLDLTPRLELIDVVDADGDGRGEFLFRETTDAGSGYAIYRATADTLWKMYDSLNPQ
jgi:hypothetical protein